MDFVWLERRREGLVAELADGECLDLPRSVVEDSVPLSAAYDTSDVGDRTQLQISPAAMRAWDCFRTHPDMPHEIETLRLVPEAAAYIGDEDTLQNLRCLLTAHLFDALDKALKATPTPSRVSPHTATQAKPLRRHMRAEQCDFCRYVIGQRLSQIVWRNHDRHAIPLGSLIQVLQALPVDDLVMVLRAALAELGPKQVDVAWHFSSSLDSPLRANAIAAAMAMLPEHLQPLVLCAGDPDVDACRRLTLSHVTLDITASIMRAAARSDGPRIDSLALSDVDMCSTQTPQQQTPSPGEVRASARRMLQPLTALSSLVEFSLSIPKEQTSSAHHAALDAALCSVLPALSQLTRLRLRSMNLTAELARDSLSVLGTLGALCELDFSGCRIGADIRPLGSPVRALGHALSVLGVLTYLGLADTAIGSAGWVVLRNGICASSMRLLLLDLRDCGLDGAFRLLPEDGTRRADTAPAQAEAVHSPFVGAASSSAAAALTGLQTLRLSQNRLSMAALCAALTPLTCLTCMHMPTSACGDGGEGGPPWPAGPLSHAGTTCLQELMWHVPNSSGTAPSLTHALGRWSELHTLSLELPIGDVSASVVPLLPRLPQLQNLRLAVIAPADIAPLLAALDTLKGLAGLALSWHGIADSNSASCGHIETSLARLSQLQSLNLNGACYPGSDAVAAALGRGLESLTQLTSLTLQSLPFAASNAQKTVKAVGAMQGLQKLALFACNIDAEAAETLLRLLPGLNALRELSVWSMTEPRDYTELWSQALGQMAVLKELEVKPGRAAVGLPSLVGDAPPALRCLRY